MSDILGHELKIGKQVNSKAQLSKYTIAFRKEIDPDAWPLFGGAFQSVFIMKPATEDK